MLSRIFRLPETYNKKDAYRAVQDAEEQRKRLRAEFRSEQREPIGGYSNDDGKH